ncbi:MAG TPA: hypothetical protein VI589_10445 [Vicinamibacteria bacterium]
MSIDNDVAAWAKAHQACFEAEPIIEMKGSEKIAAGFTLSLYARLPMDVPVGEERRKAGAALWEQLRAILDRALEGEGVQARVEVEPPRTAAVLRPENEMQPEIALRARVRHSEAFEPVTADERQRIAAFEKKISAMGLRAGHW